MTRVRSFFASQQVLEVDVPVLGRYTVSDVYLEPLSTQVCGKTRFLQTSPEYFMKRLLSQGSGAIYYLGKAFRQDEAGRQHSPEFTMLEWYMPGFDDQALMQQVMALLRELRPGVDCSLVSYGNCFKAALGVCPHTASLECLQDLVLERTSFQGVLQTRSEGLDLLFSVCVESTLNPGAVIVYDFPVEQAALARLGHDEAGQLVAKRFELFWGGLELANGYWELTDAQEQRARFDQDLKLRAELGKPAPELDADLLAALDRGLPDCAGVALGVDRLLMCLLGERDISSVMAFSPN